MRKAIEYSEEMEKLNDVKDVKSEYKAIAVVK